jgi:tRNA(Ile)-lysidine synthase
MALLGRVRRFATQHELWRAETRIVAAVSGGSDSVAMLLLLHDLHSRGELRLDAVAHFNHRIRLEADGDERFCAALAERLGITFVEATVDVPAVARQQRQSLEVAGRLARRTFLLNVRRERGADVIATAHTQDDQAETVLLRILRGAGHRGLGGIAPRARRLVRPVLFASRDELRTELQRRDVVWREDETNADVANPRNRVRHELLPHLEQRFNPSARRALARLADVARADEELLSRQAAAASVRAGLHVAGGSLTLDSGAAVLPQAIRRRVIIHALTALRPATAPALRHVEAVEAVLCGRQRAIEIPGLRVEHSGRSVVLVSKSAPGAPAPRFKADLPIPGEVRWPEAGVVVQADGPFDCTRGEPWTRPDGHAINADMVVVAADRLATSLVVRNRWPGDWLRPLGLGGRKKLQDVLIDRKVGREVRDFVPIVTDAEGRIVWVAGHLIGEEFAVTDRTNAVIILKLRRI